MILYVKMTVKRPDSPVPDARNTRFGRRLFRGNPEVDRIVDEIVGSPAEQFCFPINTEELPPPAREESEASRVHRYWKDRIRAVGLEAIELTILHNSPRMQEEMRAQLTLTRPSLAAAAAEERILD